jgi:hypothetical protein
MAPDRPLKKSGKGVSEVDFPGLLLGIALCWRP